MFHSYFRTRMTNQWQRVDTLLRLSYPIIFIFILTNSRTLSATFSFDIFFFFFLISLIPQGKYLLQKLVDHGH